MTVTRSILLFVLAAVDHCCGAWRSTGSAPTSGTSLARSSAYSASRSSCTRPPCINSVHRDRTCAARAGLRPCAYPVRLEGPPEGHRRWWWWVEVRGTRRSTGQDSLRRELNPRDDRTCRRRRGSWSYNHGPQRRPGNVLGHTVGGLTYLDLVVQRRATSFLAL